MTGVIDKSPLKLYKYRALEPFEYVADIICENRFHTAQFFDLNDPMEGFHNFEPGTKEEYLRAIREGKERLRVCSFSKLSIHPVLWAHYADGFRGICIELQVTQTETVDFELAEIKYCQDRNHFGNQAARMTTACSRMALGRKATEWKIEKEVRAFSREEFIRCQDGMKITKILLGVRMPPVMQKVIRQITPRDIRVCRIRIGMRNEIQLDEEMPAERQ